MTYLCLLLPKGFIRFHSNGFSHYCHLLCQIQISVQGFRNIASSCTGIMHLTINDMPTLTDNCLKVSSWQVHFLLSPIRWAHFSVTWITKNMNGLFIFVCFFLIVRKSFKIYAHTYLDIWILKCPKKLCFTVRLFLFRWYSLSINFKFSSTCEASKCSDFFQHSIFSYFPILS